jgi:hypothetical protein
VRGEEGGERGIFFVCFGKEKKEKKENRGKQRKVAFFCLTLNLMFV